MRPQQSSNKTFWIVAIVMCVGVGFWALSPSDSSTSSTTKKPVRKTVSSTTSTEADIQPQDYKVKFTPMVVPSTDVFKPIVYHKNAVGSAAANQPNAIPTEYSGGEADWVFTGTAEINNVAEANFQNDKLGQYAQVERGQHWKTSTVTQISPEYVMLTSNNGNSKKVLMPPDVVTEAPKTVVNAASTTVAPVNPTLSGPIGSADTTTTDTSTQTGMQQQLGGGGMGGGRRGRGGGGRRGGGGGGGGGFSFGGGG